MQSIINTAKLSGGVSLCSGFPVNSANRTNWANGVSTAYIAALKQLAITNNCGWIDLYQRFGSWATANANGFITDDIHPNANGYAEIANAYVSHIMSALA
jgi:lysophospholipase L1-like esterase